MGTFALNRTLPGTWGVPVAAAASGGLVGAGIVVTRAVIHETSPLEFAFLRYLIGALMLLPIVLRSGPIRISRRDLLPISILGIFQFGVLVVLLNAGAAILPAATTSLLFATMPILTFAVSVAVGSDSWSIFKAVGIIATLAGVALTLGNGWGLTSLSTSQLLVGAVLVLLSALVGAVCSVLYRPYLQRYSPLHVSGVAMLASTIALGAVTFSVSPVSNLAALSVNAWLGALAVGAASAIGYVCLLWALRHGSPTEVVQFQSLSSVVAVILGAVFLHEPASVLVSVGVALVIGGLWVSNQRAEREA